MNDDDDEEEEEQEEEEEGSVLYYAKNFPEEFVFFLFSLALLSSHLDSLLTNPLKKKLPKLTRCRENRLLIFHGLMDENVHFKNTEILIDTLVQLQKPYQLKVFPKERHGVRGAEATISLNYTLIQFLNNNLK